VEGHEIEIVSIEDILRRIERSTANLTEEQKRVMKFVLLSGEYKRLGDFLECLPKIQDRLKKLHKEIFDEMKKYERDYLRYKGK